MKRNRRNLDVQRAIYIRSLLSYLSAEQLCLLQESLTENGLKPSFPSCLHGWSLIDLHKLYNLCFHV